MITPNLLSVATDTAHLFFPSPMNGHGLPVSHLVILPEERGKITLRHHRGAFVGCFSLRLRKNIDWELFKSWKTNRNPAITEEMAADFLPFIRNHYDWITSPPPSAGRSPLRYCTYDLARAVSKRAGIPFTPAFSQKTDKLRHGRHASLSQSPSTLLETWHVRNSSILFLDDCITSGMTARLCYEALVGLGNHVDGLIWVNAGG